MYCNLSKTQTLPKALRVTSLNTLNTLKIQSFSHGVSPKPSLNPRYSSSRPISFGSSLRGQKAVAVQLLGRRSVLGGFCGEFELACLQLRGFRCYSSFHNAAEGGDRGSDGKRLPWLGDGGNGEGLKRRETVVRAKAAGHKSSWEVSAEKFLKKNGVSSGEDEGRRESVAVDVRESRQKPRFERGIDRAGRRGSVAGDVRESRQRPRFGRDDDRVGRRGSAGVDGRENRQRSRFERDDDRVGRRSAAVDARGNWRKPRVDRDDEDRAGTREEAVEDWRKPRFKIDDDEEEDEEEGDDDEVVDDPRWDKIKTRFSKRSYEKPEVHRWNKQESWGKKTYREAHHESTVPKMVGEGIYGVGPVLAALSAGRREFYALYVQEGLDLSKNNKKKKDKKGFEKVLKIAENISLTVKEVSKHDLNMAADNRPHQGLVLDASPLEMVTIKELDPVSTERDKGVLWVALDEVTDPQNLGAIVRSAYFFGASGVVLCAKNSAPLSGVVSKASAGSLELMEIRSCKNMMQFLSSSSDNGWRVIGGSVSSKALPLREIVPGEPTILVLGSEGTGLRTLVERSCTELVRIPSNILMDVPSEPLGDDEDVNTDSQSSGKEFRAFMAVESLNVSVAAGVLLHHFIGGNYASKNVTGDVDTETLD